MKSLDTRDSVYVTELDQLNRVYSIMKKLDTSTYVFERTLLEMKFVAPFETASGVADLARKWCEGRPPNPFYLDLALIACAQHGANPPPYLNELVAKAAFSRFTGKPPGKPQTIKKELAVSSSLYFMANLIYSGKIPLSKAARIAAQRNFELHGGDLKLKASTLERYYTERMRSNNEEEPCEEDLLFTSWDKYGWPRDAWLALINGLEEASGQLEGNRRQ